MYICGAFAGDDPLQKKALRFISCSIGLRQQGDTKVLMDDWLAALQALKMDPDIKMAKITRKDDWDVIYGGRLWRTNDWAPLAELGEACKKINEARA